MVHSPSAESDALMQLHHRLVDQLVQYGMLSDPALQAAFRAVPRHLFLPGVSPEEVYQDKAILTKEEDGMPLSSSTQPGLMASMLEQLALAPGQQVLEIGAGTGYNAALMAQIVGATGHVATVDLDTEIVEAACAHLRAARCTNVTVVEGDGADGYAACTPQDLIIITGGSWDVLPV